MIVESLPKKFSAQHFKIVPLVFALMIFAAAIQTVLFAGLLSRLIDLDFFEWAFPISTAFTVLAEIIGFGLIGFRAGLLKASLAETAEAAATALLLFLSGIILLKIVFSFWNSCYSLASSSFDCNNAFLNAHLSLIPQELLELIIPLLVTAVTLSFLGWLAAKKLFLKKR